MLSLSFVNQKRSFKGSKTFYDAYYHPSSNGIGTTNAKGAHWLEEDPALFDAPLFSMTSAEAASIDSQLRILLEVAFKCFYNRRFCHTDCKATTI